MVRQTGQPQVYTPPSTTFRPGGYVNTGGNRFYNPSSNTTYFKGQAVVKNSGVYTPIGNGYYRNPNTGNVYNPTTGAYKTPAAQTLGNAERLFAFLLLGVVKREFDCAFKFTFVGVIAVSLIERVADFLGLGIERSRKTL